TDCPFGPNEVIRHGEDGMLVPVADPRALAGAVLALLDDDDQRRAMASAARLSAQRFTLDRVLPRYVAALDPEAEAP
ncbi:MAG: glycosyltransferase, partial [Thermoanaerobaculia bacterium]